MAAPEIFGGGEDQNEPRIALIQLGVRGAPVHPYPGNVFSFFTITRAQSANVHALKTSASLQS